jgi:hypothetical protein
MFLIGLVFALTNARLLLLKSAYTKMQVPLRDIKSPALIGLIMPVSLIVAAIISSG